MTCCAVLSWLCSVSQLVYEKENKLRMMMKMHGLLDRAYWLVQYSWFLMLYCVYASAFLAFGTITKLAIFKYNDYGEQGWHDF
jgi:hypothetical protein